MRSIQVETGVDVPAHPYRLSTTAPVAGIPPLRCLRTPNILRGRRLAWILFALGEKNRCTIPSTEVMIPTQGFSPGLFGRRIRSLGRGGRRGGASFVLPPLGGMVVISHGWSRGVIVDTSEGVSFFSVARWREQHFQSMHVGESASLTPSR